MAITSMEVVVEVSRCPELEGRPSLATSLATSLAGAPAAALAAASHSALPSPQLQLKPTCHSTAEVAEGSAVHGALVLPLLSHRCFAWRDVWAGACPWGSQQRRRQAGGDATIFAVITAGASVDCTVACKRLLPPPSQSPTRRQRQGHSPFRMCAGDLQWARRVVERSRTLQH